VHKEIENILIVRDFQNVFLKEVTALPPYREIEFSVDLILGIKPILIAHYRMSRLELKELKKH